jgi:predicted alpha/beta superfamily hydrolase
MRGDSSVGADTFIRFVEGELSPWLDQRYDVTDDRTLFGASLGGLFALYVLLNHHGFFRRYVAVSPVVAADPALYDDEARRALEGGQLDAWVSLSAGACEDQLSPAMDPEMRAGLEMADIAAHTRRIGELLASRAHAGLRLTTTIMPDQTHFSMPFAGMAYGLRDVFA